VKHSEKEMDSKIDLLSTEKRALTDYA